MSRENVIGKKKQKMVKIYFFKALANRLYE